jgi:hypothetical protein
VPKTETIKKAIKCAGGVEAVALEFNLGERAIRKWWQVAKVPTDHIYRLCDLGGFTVAPHELNSSAFPKSSLLVTNNSL